MGWMALVCLRSPESGPFPSELVAHPPSPPPKQPSWGRGSAEVGRSGRGEVAEPAPSLPFLTAGSGTLVPGKVASEDVAAVASSWHQQKSPSPSVDPVQTRRLTVALSKY